MTRRRRLSQQYLRAMGVTDGLMARRIGPDGRARLEQLTPEAPGRPALFYDQDQTDVLKPRTKEANDRRRKDQAAHAVDGAAP